jgi:putative FmdB family regulatory protein
MPTYEYECKSCGYAFEAFQRMSDEPLKECPQCGKEVRRLINGGSGIIFKGSGFYTTDAKAAPAKGKKEKTKPDAAKPDGAKTEAPAACASCPAAKESGGTCPASTG